MQHHGRTTVAGLSVGDELYSLLVDEALPGTGITPVEFFDGLAALLDEFGPRNAELLDIRSEMQAAIDGWHRQRAGQPHDAAAYRTNVLLNSASAQVLGDRFLTTATAAGCPAMLMVISSGAGKNPYPGWSSYCAGKAATDMWCRTAGLEQLMRGSAISVLSMAPGVVDTAMQSMIRDQDEAAFPNVARFHDLHDGGQLGDPVEVGTAILDLAQQTCDGSVYRGATLTNGAVLDIRDLADA